MSDKRRLNDIRKKRDISRAYHAKEGSIAELADRYHASTATVQAAIKHEADWWQAEAEKLAKQVSSKGNMKPVPEYEHSFVDIGPSSQPGGNGERIVSFRGAPPPIKVSGPIEAVLDTISATGWEIVQVFLDGSGEIVRLLARRPRA